MWLIIRNNKINYKSGIQFHKKFKNRIGFLIKTIKWPNLVYNIIKNELTSYIVFNSFYSYVVFNQTSKNLKINLIRCIHLRINTVFKSTGIFLISINLVAKYLRRSFKGNRLFLNMYLKKYFNKNLQSILVLKIKGLRKENWVYESLTRLNCRKHLVFFTLTNKVNTNLKIKKSIKKRIKKKIIIKENYIW